MITDRIPRRHRGTAALLAVLVGSTGIQTSAAVATSLFEKFDPTAVSGLRLVTAAVLLLAVARPRFWRFTRSDWFAVISYGVVSTLMNVFFYQAVDRIPLGVAVTIEYLGAFGVAMVAVRRVLDGMIAIGALLGVVLIAGPTLGSANLLGYVFALGSALSMSGYTLLSARIGGGTEATSGIRGLAVSIGVGAVLLSPVSVPAMARMDAHDWLVAALIGAFGLALAFSCDAFAASMTSPAVVGVFFSLDPVIASIAGTVLLGQVLAWNAYLGIALIVASGAAVTWRTNRSAAQISTATQALQLLRTSEIPQVRRD